ncbi:hypothetical protein GYH30_037109 [Glycine max]|uniref:Uncharacterized protein n=2 Tax=Glycine subgen. Soja TaxID=1462606 RepID=A0A0R0GSL6_SOYBN|nr:hypothetical protein JHK86_037267 [Glycine max]KAH1102938.1 hypothetical protein GYH30_037109 [Glycine max]RZB82439.1 hypothetical protein D0Y65_031541 [Glycine soja]
MSESYFRFWFSETKSDKCEGFSSCPRHFSSTPNHESEKLKTSLLIVITDYQSVRSLRIHNSQRYHEDLSSLTQLRLGDATRWDEREGNGHEGHKGRECHGVQPCLGGIKGRDGGGKVRRQREGEALRGEVEAEGGSSGEEVAVLRCGRVGIVVHEVVRRSGR